MSIRVGNVVKSVGFGIYKDMRIIKTDIDSDIVRKRSSTELGRGTIIIPNMAIIKKTIVKSFDFAMGRSMLEKMLSMEFLFFAIAFNFQLYLLV